MTGGCGNIPPASRKELFVGIVPQKETKVNTEEIIASLKQELQNIEDMKVALTESQENIRQAICLVEMGKEGNRNAGTV